MGFRVTRVPSAGLETPFLEPQTRGSRGKDRACGALVSNLNIYFCLCLGYLINNILCTCLKINVCGVFWFFLAHISSSDLSL